MTLEGRSRCDSRALSVEVIEGFCRVRGGLRPVSCRVSRPRLCVGGGVAGRVARLRVGAAVYVRTPASQRG